MSNEQLEGGSEFCEHRLQKSNAKLVSEASLPLAPTANAFSATPSAGSGSGPAFAETRSKPVSQVLTASPSLPTPQRPQIICLTGKMAAGKNFICSQIENGLLRYARNDDNALRHCEGRSTEAIHSHKEDFVSIDLDKVAHEAISLCTPQILETFGDIASTRGISLTNEDGSLNRRALGKIVFSDKKLLAQQEAIIYPKIIELVNNFIEENRDKTVILNATVLFKTPELLSQCDKIIFVTAGFFTRLRRAKKRDGLPIRQILARFRNQRGLLAEYKKFAREHGIPIEVIRN